MRCGELTGAVLATLHNLRFYLDFMADLRQAIRLGTLSELAESLGTRSAGDDPKPIDPPEQRSS
jgi:queuine tRNA-ribosyltransferase